MLSNKNRLYPSDLLSKVIQNTKQILIQEALLHRFRNKNNLRTFNREDHIHYREMK